MQVESEAKLGSSGPSSPGDLEQIYAEVFHESQPRRQVSSIRLEFKRYTGAKARIQFLDGVLIVQLSDLLEGAPEPVHRALAEVLIAKLFRQAPPVRSLRLYRGYLNRAPVRQQIDEVRKTRGRKQLTSPQGKHYDLSSLFEEINQAYFHGLMPCPRLGWSHRASKSTLGHYDPSHHTIVLSRLLDQARVPRVVVEFVLFHEMLHIRYPAQHRGTRRRVHTAEFQAAEREFRHFQEAKAQLRTLVDLPAVD